MVTNSYASALYFNCPPQPPTPFLNKANLSTALQAGQKGEKLIKSFLRSNKWLFFAILPFYFVVI